jgi:outer membrane protein assembly factor BamB
MPNAARCQSVRRRALLRSCGLAGLAGLSGCAGLLGDDSPGESNDGTVNPDLQGTPTITGGAAWSVAVSDIYGVEGVEGNFLVSIPAETDTVRYHAFDARSGTEKWTTEPLPRDSYVVDLTDVLLAVSNSPPGQSNQPDSAAAINPETGAILWRTGERTDLIGIAADALLFRDIESDGDRSTIRVIDRRTGRKLWTATAREEFVRLRGDEVVTVVRNPTTPTDTPTATPTDTPTATPTDTPTEAGTHTSTQTESRPSQLRGRSPRTGEIRWRVAVPLGIENVPAFRPQDDRILFLRDYGDYLVVDTDAGEVVLTGSVSDELSVYPTARRGTSLYFGDWTFRGPTPEPGSLSGIDTEDGSSWTREFSGTSVRPVERPTITGPRRWAGGETVDPPATLYANHLGDDIETVAHDPGDGTARWRREAITVSLDERGPVVSQPGALVALDADGGERWRSAIPFDGRVTNGIGPEDGGYAIRLGEVLFVSGDGGVASYDLTDGTRRQSITAFDLSDTPQTALADQTVVFARDGRLHAFRL